MRRLTGLVRRCIDDYGMIEEGESIAAGISGGKDSLAMLCALSELRKYYPKKYELTAISVDLGLGMDFSGIEALCADLGVPLHIERTQISEVVFDIRKEENPCSLCSKMRKGALVGAAKKLGIRKIALGHHRDDAAETMLMSLIFEGRISCFRPVTNLDRQGVFQIRPMLYVGEKMTSLIAQKYSLPVLKNACPNDGVSKRQEIKTLVLELDDRYPGLRDKIFGAMQRYPLAGWDKQR
ncbi:MAG: tRNA lysidine(34) synthetase [Oscillospiraceae bacterium]|jgi:tRNA 2-thiocytidine biosynthesis protein TtcA